MYIHRPVYGPHDTLDRGGGGRGGRGPCRRTRLSAYLHARYKPLSTGRLSNLDLSSSSTYIPARPFAIRSVIICRAFRRGAGAHAALHSRRVGRNTLASLAGIPEYTPGRRSARDPPHSISFSLGHDTRRHVMYRISRMPKDISSSDFFLISHSNWLCVKYVSSENFMKNVL